MLMIMRFNETMKCILDIKVIKCFYNLSIKADFIVSDLRGELLSLMFNLSNSSLSSSNDKDITFVS